MSESDSDDWEEAADEGVPQPLPTRVLKEREESVDSQVRKCMMELWERAAASEVQPDTALEHCSQSMRRHFRRTRAV